MRDTEDVQRELEKTRDDQSVANASRARILKELDSITEEIDKANRPELTHVLHKKLLDLRVVTTAVNHLNKKELDLLNMKYSKTHISNNEENN